MIVYSNDFKHDELMDSKFTCDDMDISPHLKWDEVPKGTKSFALFCIEPFSEFGIVSHWNIYNIPPTIREIPQGGPAPGIELENDFSTLYYEGPCPKGTKSAFHFVIHALNVEKLENLNTINFRKVVRANSIESAEIIGLYERKIPDRLFL